MRRMTVLHSSGVRSMRDELVALLVTERALQLEVQLGVAIADSSAPSQAFAASPRRA